MERINGYKIIDDYKCIYFSDRKISRNKIYKLTDGNIEWFYKVVGTKIQYKELFYSTILKNKGLNTITYDLAQYKGKFGIISKNYNPKNLPNISLANVIKEYQKANSSRIYNVIMLPEIIETFCVEHKYKYNPQIKNELFFRFMIQIFLANSDLSEPNIELLIDEPIELTSYYDFESCGTINLNDDINSYLMDTYMLEYNAEINSFPTSFKILTNFLKNGTSKELEIFKIWLEKMKETNTKMIIEEIEEKTSKRFPNELKLRLIKNYQKNLQNIDSIVSKKSDNKID